MSHNIKYADYPENCNKAKVEKDWNTYVAHEDWQEGASGLPSPIRWIDQVCDSYEDAHRYIEEHDKGWYDQLAVKYRHYPTLVKTKKLLDLEQRSTALSKKLYDEECKVRTKEMKSAYVSCKKCGSKLSTEFLNSNFCPLCHNDLRSPTTLNSIKRLKEQAKAVKKAADEEYRKCCEKQKKKAEIRWLVKVEYHT